MPVNKKKVSIVLPKDVELSLNKLAELDRIPLEAKALKVLKSGLELEEDQILTKIVKQREKKKSKFYSHDKAWA